MSQLRIHIAYGSESGNTEALAQQLIQQPFLQPYSPTLATINDTDFATFDQQSLLILLTSSFGDGEPPANANAFSEKMENLTAVSFRYCLFGLGDTTYDKFCGFSQSVEQQLQTKRAKPLIERVDADLNYQAIFKQWLPLLQQAIETLPEQAISHQLSVQVYNEQTTYDAEVLEIKQLANSEPPVYHIRLSLKDSGIFYQAGDLLYVRVQQPEALLQDYVQWFNDPNAAELLRHKELRLLSKNVLRDIQKICGNAELKDLTKISNKKSLEQYLYGRDVLDVLRDFDPKTSVSLTDLSDILANLTARAYSISSCSECYPDYVDLCVRYIGYQLNDRLYQGTASGYLAQLKPRSKIAVFLKSNPTFHLPTNPSTPIVMIGAGTGIAPYIGFLQRLASLPNKVESDLFFGERYQAKDFLYQTELQQFQQQGVLTGLFTAFSRDQAEKYYVQNALADQAEHVWQRIQQGAIFYVCGSKTMSKAVDETLIEIAQKIGNKPYIDDFNNIIAELIANGQLFRDIY